MTTETRFKCDCDDSGTQACSVCAPMGAELDKVMADATAHEYFAGSMCTFVNGMCEICDVGEDECPECNGIGYHNGLCPESEAN